MALLLAPGPRRSLSATSRRRLLGVVFLAIMLGALYLTVAVYQKKFSSTVPVMLRASSVGNQLTVGADVKLRGILVGRVSDVHSTGRVATLQLQLDPDQVARIPANVSAALLPKTLFGEKFVDLIIPAKPSSASLQAGDVIPQDRSRTAIETGQVFDDLLPVLRTLQPAKLSATLNALASALAGRGDELGQNLALLQNYLAGLDPHLSTIQADISGLADVAASYAGSAPDLLRVAANLATTSRTVVAKNDALANFLRGTAGFADTATTILTDNADRLIELTGVARPTLETLANYSGEFPCFFYGLYGQEQLLNDAFGGPQGPFLHITVEAVRQRPTYTAADVPSYRPGQTIGTNHEVSHADCKGLPQPGQPLPATPGSAARPSTGAGASSSANAPTSYTPAGPTSVGAVGSPVEQSAVDAVVARLTGTPPNQVPDVADLLVAPMLRGMAVGVDG